MRAVVGRTRAGLALLLAAIAAAHGQEAEGYRLFRGEVIVEGREHWLAWEGVAAAREVGLDGAVRPRHLRRGVNAVLDAHEFENVVGTGGLKRKGGIYLVGFGNMVGVGAIVDGDPSTSWPAPVRTMPPEKIWFEIDLGRGVLAERVVVRFAEDGDPFLQFRVLASDGEESFGTRRERRFFRVGQEAAPNKTRRVFAYDVLPQRPRPDGVPGEPIQFLRVEMLGTDGPRGHEVTADEYQALPATERGAIDHYLRTVAGRLIRVVQQTWSELPEEERGPVRYYRWEAPRLAEVEVWTLGDNAVALTQRPLFHLGDFFDDIAKRFVTDGLFSSSYFVRLYNPFRDRNQIQIDLGARFWLDQVRLVSARNPPTSYQLRLSDGALDATGAFLWQTLDERLNREEYLDLAEAFPLQPVRFLELRRLNLLGGPDQGELAELQAYGEGYVSQVDLTSPLVKLEERTMFTRLRWEGQVPPGTGVEVRTRTGDDLIQIPHYYNRAGQEVSEGSYRMLKAADKGPIRVEELEGPDWSPWSPPYTASGQAFQSPMPRRLTRVRVRLRSADPARAAALSRLSLDTSPPLVDRAEGEVWPVRGVPPGVWRPFHLYVRLRPRPGDAGVRSLRIATTSSTPIELEGVRTGEDADLRFGSAEGLWPGPAAVASGDDGSLEVTFPESRGRRAELYEIRLRAKMFLPGTAFRVELRNPARPALVQVVDPGAATELVATGSLTVTARLEGARLLDSLRVEPPVLTPNGDGVNDGAVVRATVYQVEGRRSIRIAVCDLAGRRVRDLSIAREFPSGEHRVPWDGRDDAGRLVPPGTYLVEVEVDTDALGALRRACAVGVAY